ncbi:MAG: tRNA (adenosine(37)-N6)-dimethylallyltransferase MiaA [Candidatus Omnitrophica bacterium]|nr:tRNA (adenosine(37)-N6)-dimethylallyltransferase MiaA [Candidatus Omnitrophota bacterium]
MPKPRIIFILGPTAVGKSEFALRIAKKLNAEIVSCDSMQVYKGMDIISSKPSVCARRKIPHHLIDIIPAQKEFNASLYRNRALKAIKTILKKKKTPLFNGGTGLYASAVLDGIFKGPGEDKKIRQRLYQQAEKKGTRHLYQRLQKVDPQAGERIHPHDLRRIIRALEVWIKTKKPISQWQKKRRGITQRYNVEIYCLNRAREELYTRINQRVEQMFKKGLVNEVAHLLKKKNLSKTASCAIGIKEIKDYLEGKYSLNEAKSLIKKHTRQYAKRQLTWFRKDKRIIWISTNLQFAIRDLFRKCK